MAFFRVALSFVLEDYIYIKIYSYLFPKETTIRNASKGLKPDRKPYLP